MSLKSELPMKVLDVTIKLAVCIQNIWVAWGQQEYHYNGGNRVRCMEPYLSCTYTPQSLPLRMSIKSVLDAVTTMIQGAGCANNSTIGGVSSCLVRKKKSQKNNLALQKNNTLIFCQLFKNILLCLLISMHKPMIVADANQPHTVSYTSLVFITALRQCHL